MPNTNDILAIFAKHTNWQDQGDRETVADFLGRNPNADDTFGPETDENRAIRDDQDDDDDQDQGDTKNEPIAPSGVKPTAPKTAGTPVNRK